MLSSRTFKGNYIWVQYGSPSLSLINYKSMKSSAAFRPLFSFIQSKCRGASAFMSAQTTAKRFDQKQTAADVKASVYSLMLHLLLVRKVHTSVILPDGYFCRCAYGRMMGFYGAFLKIVLSLALFPQNRNHWSHLRYNGGSELSFVSVSFLKSPGIYMWIKLLVQGPRHSPFVWLFVLLGGEPKSACANICECHCQRFPHPLSHISFNEILT